MTCVIGERVDTDSAIVRRGSCAIVWVRGWNEDGASLSSAVKSSSVGSVMCRVGKINSSRSMGECLRQLSGEGGGEGNGLSSRKIQRKESKPRVLDGKRENDDTRGEQQKTGGRNVQRTGAVGSM
jgi:hypothetical protein